MVLQYPYIIPHIDPFHYIAKDSQNDACFFVLPYFSYRYCQLPVTASQVWGRDSHAPTIASKERPYYHAGR